MRCRSGKARWGTTRRLGAAAWPLATRAQQPALPVIGWLSVWEPQQNPSYVAAFRKGLKEAGFIEGQNVAIEFRWSGEQPDRLPTLAADLVYSVIIADTNAVLAAKAATSSIPIVFALVTAAFQRETRTIPILFATGSDPIGSGFVAGLSRPGGNLTGFMLQDASTGGKLLQMLTEIAPSVERAAIMFNPNATPIEARRRPG
jgi:putative tryptophan/tyrosine transport system substrate-binding protein